MTKAIVCTEAKITEALLDYSTVMSLLSYSGEKGIRPS